jgi:predicted restriction endonuclease
VENHTLLTASHIKPWIESEPKEKLDVDNGFLMCPNHDKLFDKGYITFDDEGNIIISDSLKENDRLFLNVNDKMYIELTEKNKMYLKFHRENVFKK